MSTTLFVDPPPVATAPPASRASWSGVIRQALLRAEK